MLIAQPATRRNGSLRAVVILVALATVGCQPVTPRTPLPKVNEPMREIEEAYLSGVGPRSLAEARGMVVVLEFWATYCDPCRRSFPAYEALHRQGGVAVISVALDEPSDVAEESIKRFADETGATFPVLWDRDQSSLATYGLRKMPSAFVIDQHGVLRHTHGGYEAATMSAIQQQVTALLGDAPSP